MILIAVLILLLYLLHSMVEPLRLTLPALRISDVTLIERWSTLSRRYPSGFC